MRQAEIAELPKEEQVQHVAENVATVVESPEEAYVPYQDDQPLNADPRSTFFYFDVNETRMDSSILQNEVLMKSLQYVIGDALNDPTLRITRIQVIGLASFDGNLRYNQRLAASRANTIKKYIQGIYPIDDSVFDLSNGGENWAELRYIVEQMEFEGKDEVLRIIETEPNLDERERRIKQLNGGKTYSYIRDNMQQTLRNLGYITVFLERVKE